LVVNNKKHVLLISQHIFYSTNRYHLLISDPKPKMVSVHAFRDI